MNPPEIFVLGGPNGAGKSTSAMVLLPESLSIHRFVNADLIAQGISPFDPQLSAMEAGRMMLQRIRQFRDDRVSFAFETTLASRTFVRFLTDAQIRGYIVHVIYIWLETVELALSRVAHRVRLGGHDVASDIVRRRYRRGLRNLLQLYTPLADSWTICDNSGTEPEIVVQGGSGPEATVFSPTCYDRILRSFEQ